APLDVLANDTVDSLSKRVQQREHLLYPLVLQWRAEQRLELNQNGVMLDAKPLPEQGFQLV
ncbi:MAG TPA: phosphoribosylglycinamide formyltransferase, partial [Alcanivorax sp.]|nr:phosphoribosylglycinamide formyltransferase [Alcanivorax sp.]